MPRKSQTALKSRTAKIISVLSKRYPHAQTALRHANPFQLLVATILSAQCTDERVNSVTRELFKKYKTPADLAAASQKQLEDEIRSTGFFRNKAKNLRAASAKIVEDFSGKTPDSMAELLTLPGVARKTANVVLSGAFGKNEGIVVDTHVKRLAGRLGLSSQKTPEKIEQDLMKLVPRRKWGTFSHMLIYHGRAVCTARRPNCAGCQLNKLCPSAFKV